MEEPVPPIDPIPDEPVEVQPPVIPVVEDPVVLPKPQAPVKNKASNLQKIMQIANRHPSPLPDDEFKDFARVIQPLWHLSNLHGIELPFINFVFFGPQSAGKSSLIERFMKFPITKVAAGIGTRRPLVVTINEAPEEKYQCYEELIENGRVVRSPVENLEKDKIRDRIIIAN